jgi:hypothetical protein
MSSSRLPPPRLTQPLPPTPTMSVNISVTSPTPTSETRPASPGSRPRMQHHRLKSTFVGVEHALSTFKAPIAQYRGIPYAICPARFRRSKLIDSYPAEVDATRFG